MPSGKWLPERLAVLRVVQQFLSALLLALNIPGCTHLLSGGHTQNQGLCPGTLGGQATALLHT